MKQIEKFIDIISELILEDSDEPYEEIWNKYFCGLTTDDGVDLENLDKDELIEWLKSEVEENNTNISFYDQAISQMIQKFSKLVDISIRNLSKDLINKFIYKLQEEEKVLTGFRFKQSAYDHGVYYSDELSEWLDENKWLLYQDFEDDLKQDINKKIIKVAEQLEEAF